MSPSPTVRGAEVARRAPITRRAAVAALVALVALTPACSRSLFGGGAGELAVTPPRVVEIADPPRVALEAMFDGAVFQRPLDACQAPGDADTWYVVEQGGLVFRMAPGPLGWTREVFLDLSERVSRRGNEEGLLGIAFSPHWGQPGHPHGRALYASWSLAPGPLSHLSRFHADESGLHVDADSEELLLAVPQPYRNHNGGCVAFGPDGFLYTSFGDGGAADDPHGNGQDPGTLLGTILRLDVAPRDDGRPYGIPADNPLRDRAGARPEVFAYGLRNAWRFSFDRQTGELWAADVGQDDYESVFVVRPGANHGWNRLEGFHRFALPAGETPPEDLVPPVFAYDHGDGLSITGGFVYRGDDIPDLVGWYVFADYITSTLWAVRRRANGTVEHVTLPVEAQIPSSFAQGHDGELLVLSHMVSRRVYRLVPVADGSDTLDASDAADAGG